MFVDIVFNKKAALWAAFLLGCAQILCSDGCRIRDNLRIQLALLLQSKTNRLIDNRLRLSMFMSGQMAHDLFVLLSSC